MNGLRYTATIKADFDPGTLSPAAYMRLFGTPKPDNLAIAIARAIRNPR